MLLICLPSQTGGTKWQTALPLAGLCCIWYPTPEITHQHSTMGQTTHNCEYTIYSQCIYIVSNDSPILMRTQHCRKSCCLVAFCPLVPFMGNNNTQISGLGGWAWRGQLVSAFNHRSRWFQVQTATTRNTLRCYKVCKDDWRNNTRNETSKN